MSNMLFFFYTIAIYIGNIYIYLGRLFSPKLSSLYIGRKRTWETLTTFAQLHQNSCWIHCASLGEFEQGRPLIEKLRVNYPELPIVLSFYSPSGFEIMKHYDRVDAVFYLPSDLPSNNKRLLKLINPSIIIFVKYEFWWNLLAAITQQGRKVFLVSAVFRKGNYFFKSMFRPFLSILSKYQTIFVQDQDSAELLSQHKIMNHTVAGDTRIDRVIQRSKSAEVPENIRIYCNERTTIVYGSVWMTDMDTVSNVIRSFPEMNHILAPHDISEANIQKIRTAIKRDCDLYSDCEWSHQVMIIDNIGMLGGLYQLAKYAFVGGGFQSGIHNILEPAVFRIPVFFGPNFKKFNEAVILTQSESVFSINNGNEMMHKIVSLEPDNNAYNLIANNLSQYFIQNKGATDFIISALEKHILLNFK